ncbi:hypothetical protein ACLOJK_016123 [Asimina triloba]
MEDEGSTNKKSQTSLIAEKSSGDAINNGSENVGVNKGPSSEDKWPSNVVKDESRNGEQPSEMNLLKVEPSNEVKSSGNMLDNQNIGEDKARSEMKSLNIAEENPNHHNENTEAKSSGNTLDDQNIDEGKASSEVKSQDIVEENPNHHNEKGEVKSSGSGNALDDQTMHEDEATSEVKSLNNVEENPNHHNEKGEVKSSGNMLDDQTIHQDKATSEIKYLNIVEENPNRYHEKGEEALTSQVLATANQESGNQAEKGYTTDEFHGDKEAEPVFDGTEIPGLEAAGTSSSHSLDVEPGVQGSAWPEKAMAIRDFVREKGVTAVSSVFRRLSGKGDEDGQTLANEHDIADNPSMGVKGEVDTSPGSKAKEVSQQTGERSMWNPLNFIRHVDVQNNSEQGVGFSTEDSVQVPGMKGRVILYTRLGCQNSREIRKYLHQKRLQYIEINIDIYPSRKAELEKIAGSSAVPRVFFNDLLIGGLGELKAMDESGELDQRVNDLTNTEPSPGAPLPPSSGEDDESRTGTVDELAIIVRKMRESITVKDRFYKMRRFTNCFLGSEAVDFFSEDQYFERDEAVEFGRKLAKKYFFKHVLEENVFEDSNELYRFLDHDPFVMSQCFNFSRGIIEVKPKPLVEISSRLRFLMFAMFEAYVSEDGRHVNYQTIRSSEEFARKGLGTTVKVIALATRGCESESRETTVSTQALQCAGAVCSGYLRIIEELQRVDFQDVSREEKLAFFINLHNMMVIHAILTWGYPSGALDRRRLLGDFKYVIGGCTYSLSAIQNGILRANQRPPYNITKPFGARDMRLKVALLQHEPLIHFALVCGNRSGPALRCYSPGDIDEELVAAAHDFLVNGGLVVDAEAKLASASKVLKWYSADFGKNEAEVMKHVASYLEPAQSREFLDLLSSAQMKVRYQPFDWSLNC